MHEIEIELPKDLWEKVEKLAEEENINTQEWLNRNINKIVRDYIDLTENIYNPFSDTFKDSEPKNNNYEE